MIGYKKLSLIVFIFSTLVFSQDLVTDRPDFTESAIVVPKKHVQFELGAQMESVESENVWSYPNLLVRIGLSEKAELRLGFPGWSQTGTATANFQDLYVEGKYQLTASDATIPMAILLAASVPSGHEAVSSGKSDYGFKYAAAYDVSNRIGLGANVGLFSVGGEDQRFLSALASISCGIAVTEKLGVFLEAFADMPENGSWTPMFDAGCTYLVRPLLQLDAYFGIGLNDYATDHFVGLGCSFLL